MKRLEPDSGILRTNDEDDGIRKEYVGGEKVRMIVYSATKTEFNDDVNLNRISDIILQNLREKHLSGGQLPEYHSWQNSLHFMRAVIDDPQIPGDADVAMNLHPHAVLSRVLWRWYQNASGL